MKSLVKNQEALFWDISSKGLNTVDQVWCNTGLNTLKYGKRWLNLCLENIKWIYSSCIKLHGRQTKDGTQATSPC